MKSRTLLLGALLATTALLAACSTDPGSGPLAGGGLGNTAGGDCVPEPVDHPITDGVYVLDNTGTSPVTITSVKLTSPRGLATTRAWLIPINKPKHGAESSVGVNDYPPIHWPTWPERQPIPGAVIKPGRDLNLFFGIMRPTASTGRTDGVIIAYTAGGNSYTLTQPYGFIITASNAACE